MYKEVVCDDGSIYALSPLLQLQLIQMTFFIPITVGSLLTDTPNKGHCIKYLSTMDKTKSPNFNSPINIMQLESLNRGQSLYSGQTT